MADIKKSGSSYSRRQFLINAARMAGAVAAYPLLSSPVMAAASQDHAVSKSAGGTNARGTRTVGLLLPRSSYYTELSWSFLAGMSLYAGQAIKIVTEDIGSGAQSVQQKLESMLQKNQIDMMIGLVNPSVAISLQSTLEAANIPFLASGLGENVARNVEYDSNIYFHTLGLWQSNWALGQWAAANLGSSAVLGSSAYDSGFDAVYAFRAGFESAGGQIVANPITHAPGDTSGFTGLLASIRETRPSFVFAGYYGQLAVDFLKAYAAAGLSGTTPLVGTSYLTDQRVLQASGGAPGIKTAASWSQALVTPENQAFVAAYQGKTGTNPNSFALLGYEAAQIVAGAAKLAGTNNWSMNDALGVVQFSGPRGLISMSNHSTNGAVYLQEVERQGKTTQNVVLFVLKSNAEQDGRIADLRTSAKTGWLNTYLCE